MKRDVSALAAADYDVLIVGGGINGVTAARDAALRGLRVALVERGDFGWATSSQSAKIAHSGMRYLQHGDVKRLRESVRERNAIVANAPHLIDSVPFLLPIYGHGVTGRETTSIYLKVFDLLSLDRRFFADADRRIPGSEIISRKRVVEMVPGVPTANLTGGGIWYEGVMHNTERMLIARLRSAVDAGARVANYVEATKINVKNGRVTGVDIVDRTTEQRYTVAARCVLNATGPWIVSTLLGIDVRMQDHDIHLSKAFSLVTRPLTEGFALSFPIRPMYRDKKALVEKGSSMTFAIPWRDTSIVGSLHLACGDDPDAVTITEDEIETYIERVNEGYPAANLRRSDVRRVLWGLIPAEEKGSAAPLKQYRIIDHRVDQVHGLVTVLGVKYTTARDVAEKAVDLVLELLNTRSGRSVSRKTPLWGGDIGRIRQFFEHEVERQRSHLAPEITHRLVRTYGSRYVDIIRYVDDCPDLARTLPDSHVIEAEVIHAIRDEMALTLTDVMLRRTDLGSANRPSDACICACAALMARELGWDSRQSGQQVEALERAYALDTLAQPA